MAVEIHPLVPRNLQEVWDTIKPYLEEMKAGPDPALSTWRVEDVYAAVLQERAVIYTTDDGFAICMVDTDEFSLKSDLFIWIAYAYQPKRGNILAKYLPSFIEVAKDLGYSGVSTVSNHPALAKMTGMTPIYTRYRVEVDESTT